MVRTAGCWDGAGMFAARCLPSAQAGVLSAAQKEKADFFFPPPSLTPKLLTAILPEKQNVPVKRRGAAVSLGLKSRGQQEELEQTFGSF